jgi:hypothetical protein
MFFLAYNKLYLSSTVQIFSISKVKNLRLVTLEEAGVLIVDTSDAVFVSIYLLIPVAVVGNLWENFLDFEI